MEFGSRFQRFSLQLLGREVQWGKVAYLVAGRNQSEKEEGAGDKIYPSRTHHGDPPGATAPPLLVFSHPPASLVDQDSANS